jgi:hypothetical protein
VTTPPPAAGAGGTADDTNPPSSTTVTDSGNGNGSDSNGNGGNDSGDNGGGGIGTGSNSNAVPTSSPTTRYSTTPSWATTWTPTNIALAEFTLAPNYVAVDPNNVDNKDDNDDDNNDEKTNIDCDMVDGIQNVPANTKDNADKFTTKAKLFVMAAALTGVGGFVCCLALLLLLLRWQRQQDNSKGKYHPSAAHNPKQVSPNAPINMATPV